MRIPLRDPSVRNWPLSTFLVHSGMSAQEPVFATWSRVSEGEVERSVTGDSYELPRVDASLERLDMISDAEGLGAAIACGSRCPVT